MDNEELDLSWAEGQIAAARVPVPVGKATLALLRVWAELTFPNEAQQTQAIELFSKLAQNQAVVEEGEGRWAPVHVGAQVNVGDTVRVRSDAFTGQAGQTHNGRIGRVTAKRSGDIIVKTTDNRPVLDGAHYPPSALERKVG